MRGRGRNLLANAVCEKIRKTSLRSKPRIILKYRTFDENERATKDVFVKYLRFPPWTSVSMTMFRVQISKTLSCCTFADAFLVCSITEERHVDVAPSAPISHP